MEDVEKVAITALREAAQALAVGTEADSSAGKLGEWQKPNVAAEVATVLEAITGLLRRVDLAPVPSAGADHSLRAVTQHVDAGAELARRVADRRELDPTPRSTHPEARLDDR